jgi:hypothetical protein
MGALRTENNKFVGVTPDVTTEVVLYEVPDTQQAQMKLYVCNNSTTTATATVFLKKPNEDAVPLLPGVSFAGDAFLDEAIQWNVNLDQGDKVIVQSSIADTISYILTGLEFKN